MCLHHKIVSCGITVTWAARFPVLLWDALTALVGVITKSQQPKRAKNP